MFIMFTFKNFKTLRFSERIENVRKETMFCIVKKSEDAFKSGSRDRREGKDNWLVLFHKTFDPGIIYLII